jgi:organic hydroperoxide reductase OsmC/OhrA
MKTIRLAISAILIVTGVTQTAKLARAGSSDNWLGGTGNWSTAANWSAGVPTSSSAVSIGNTQSGSVMEDLTNAAAASCPFSTATQFLFAARTR